MTDAVPSGYKPTETRDKDLVSCFVFLMAILIVYLKIDIVESFLIFGVITVIIRNGKEIFS
ncbi:MAG: hypothetical protein LUQ07_03925 [Methanospirillum sp.]|nr:hypothetical protein [Methanospirillum sp.]